MAIIDSPACKCAVCGATWLPNPTKLNPDGDPRKVKRCSACKSWNWNDDDPEVAARKATPRPRSEKQIAVQVKPKPRYGKVLAGICRSVICIHRVRLVDCALCGGK